MSRSVNLYFLSGLGADKRVFSRLRLPENYLVRHIEWIPPGKEETLPAYAARLLSQVETDKPFILAGLSFGGMIALEMSKLVSPVQTVLLSSITGPAEIPRAMRWVGRLGLYRLIPRRFLLQPSRTVFRLFGVRTADQQELLRRILHDTDPGFFAWALGSITRWDNRWRPSNLLHLHGTEDKVLPYTAAMRAIPVPGGGHLMVYNQAEIVSDLLTKFLAR